MTNQDQVGTPPLDTAPALVIFVHGTGAASRNASHPHWWQPTSEFSRRIKDIAGKAVRIVKPQRWTGFNLESSRRGAGRELWKRLARLEERGLEYHLVGHSHGGSVIWHALIESARANQKLKGLKTWTTVGTPFLSFRPDPTAWWRLIGLIIAATAAIWLSSLTVEIGSERTSLLAQFAESGIKAQFYALIAVALLVLVVLRATYLFVLVARQAYDIAGHFALRIAEKRAAEWYRQEWIALWHERDEAISGLRASLVTSPQLLPRWSTGNKATFRRVLFWAYDRGFAQAVDQFVWAVGMQRAQGIDIFDQRMDRAQHCPSVLAPGWAPLPLGIAHSLTESADAGAAAATAAFRERLSTAGDFQHADEVFSSFASTWTWQELIHTSYFDQEPIVELIAERFKRQPSTPVDSRFGLLRLVAAEERPAQRAGIFALPFNRALASLGITVLLTVSAVSTYAVAIAPYTTRFLIEQVAAESAGATLASIPNSDLLGEVILRLAALGQVPDFMQKLDDVLDRTSKEETAKLFSRAFGRLFPDVDVLLTPQVSKHRARVVPGSKDFVEFLEKEPLPGFITALRVYPSYRYQAQILAGLVETNKKPTPEFVATIEENIRQREPLLANAPGWESEAAMEHPGDESTARYEVGKKILEAQYAGSIQSIATDLLIAGYDDAAGRIVDQAFQWNGRKLQRCNRDSFDYIKRAAAYGTLETIAKLPSLCGSRRVYGSDLTDAALAADEAGRTEMAGALLDMAQTASRGFESALSFWRFGRLQLDRGRLPEAFALIEKWLKYVEGQPSDLTRLRGGGDILARLDVAKPSAEEERVRLEQIKSKVVNAIVGGLEKAYSDPIPAGLSQDLVARELAAAYMMLGRGADAALLAKASEPPPTQAEAPDPLGIGESRRAEGRRNRVRASLQAGLLHEIAGEKARSLEHYRASVSMIEGIWATERYEAGCLMYTSALPSDTRLAHRAIDAAAAQAAREPDLEKRAGMLGNLAIVAAKANEPRRAISYASRAGRPDIVLYGYALALDQIVKARKPEVYKRWGFATHRLQASWNEYLLKANDLPKCDLHSSITVWRAT